MLGATVVNLIKHNMVLFVKKNECIPDIMCIFLLEIATVDHLQCNCDACYIPTLMHLHFCQ